MDIPYWVAALVFIGVLAALVLIIIQNLQKLRLQAHLRRIEALYDAEILVSQKQKDAARDVVPYLAKTSVDMFYGEQEGVQYNFAQRQEISRKVQHQNTALRRFSEVFGVTPMQEAMARAATGDPDAKADVAAMAMVEELGPDDDLPPASSSPW